MINENRIWAMLILIVFFLFVYVNDCKLRLENSFQYFEFNNNFNAIYSGVNVNGSLF